MVCKGLGKPVCRDRHIRVRDILARMVQSKLVGKGAAQTGPLHQSWVQPIQRAAVANKKTNEVSRPSCFLINISF